MSESFFSTSVVGGERAIREVLLQGLIRILDKVIDDALPLVKESVGEVVRVALLQSPEYLEITSGPIWHELGIPRPEFAVGKVIEQVKVSVSLIKMPITATNSITGGFRIGILPANYQDLLNLPEASFVSFTRAAKNATGDKSPARLNQIEWLKWLLLEGGGVILPEYRYEAVASVRSRTGFGLMAVSPEGWSVPSSIAGTADDNWLTRVLLRNMNLIFEAIESGMNKGP